MKKVIILVAFLVCGILSMSMLFCSAFIVSWLCQGTDVYQIFFNVGWKVLLTSALMIIIPSILLIKEIFNKS